MPYGKIMVTHIRISLTIIYNPSFLLSYNIIVAGQCGSGTKKFQTATARLVSNGLGLYKAILKNILVCSYPTYIFKCE